MFTYQQSAPFQSVQSQQGYNNQPYRPSYQNGRKRRRGSRGGRGRRNYGYGNGGYNSTLDSTKLATLISNEQFKDATKYFKKIVGGKNNQNLVDFLIDLKVLVFLDTVSMMSDTQEIFEEICKDAKLSETTDIDEKRLKELEEYHNGEHNPFDTENEIQKTKKHVISKIGDLFDVLRVKNKNFEKALDIQERKKEKKEIIEKEKEEKKKQKRIDKMEKKRKEDENKLLKKRLRHNIKNNYYPRKRMKF